VWRKACADAGIKGLHFHDLRHTGNTMAAATGASTKELMARFGHGTARAALIYQHATEDRQRDQDLTRCGTPVARGGVKPRNEDRPQVSEHAADLGPNRSERATGIEPA